MGNKTRTTGGSMRRIATVLATIGALVMSTGLALLVVGTSPANAAAEKYFVCKFVGTPGEDEVLKDGKNPISVSANAIPLDPVVVGAFFEDAQGRSFVLAADEGQELGREDCLPKEEENEEIAVDVVPADPTCELPTTYTLTGDTANASDPEEMLSEDGTALTVTVTANEGYEFAGGESTYSETFPYSDVLDPDSDACAEVSPPGEPEEPQEPEAPEEPTVVVEPPTVTPTVTPTVVSAGLLPTASDVRSEQGLALLVGGMIMMMVAGGLGLVRPGGSARS